ncbi:hypothetical protein NPN16_24230, partial [Vibrio parahaemolyticus]|nr:hypothetical protein [Vibrio parahaemolyticus]
PGFPKSRCEGPSREHGDNHAFWIFDPVHTSLCQCITVGETEEQLHWVSSGRVSALLFGGAGGEDAVC